MGKARVYEPFLEFGLAMVRTLPLKNTTLFVTFWVAWAICL